VFILPYRGADGVAAIGNEKHEFHVETDAVINFNLPSVLKRKPEEAHELCGMLKAIKGVKHAPYPWNHRSRGSMSTQYRWTLLLLLFTAVGKYAR
jgi:hypothetical protein